MVAGRSLRIVFFGTPAFAVPTLDALLASTHKTVGVVTQPDRPRGRGQKISDGPVRHRAREAGLPVLQPARLKDAEFVAALGALNADLAVVAAYGKILSAEVLAVPRLGFINVHASLLPRYRGAAPVHRAVIAGDLETGVTIMRVVEALDAGPMMASAARAIGPDDTSDDVERELARIGANLLVETVDAIAAGRATETAQDERAATYAHRLTKDDGAIDWSRSPDEVHNLVRGLHPWPHAYSFVDGRRIIFRRSAVVPNLKGVPGTVLEASGDRLIVAAGTGAVAVTELQSEGKRPMSAREFLAGHRISPGARFIPQSDSRNPQSKFRKPK